MVQNNPRHAEASTNTLGVIGDSVQIAQFTQA